MKKFYSKSMSALFIGAFGLMSMAPMQAQIDLTWKGAVSSDANNPENWLPVGGMDGNNLIVPHVGNYADPETPNHPVVTRDSEILVNSISVAGPYSFNEPQFEADGTTPILDADGVQVTVLVEHPRGELTISMPDGLGFSSTTSGSIYMNGKLVVNAGVLSINRSFYMDKTSSELLIEGTGRMTVGGNGYFLLGPNNGADGGKVIVRDDGHLTINHTGGIGRWNADPENSVTIQGNGTILLNTDHREALGYRVETGQLNGGADFYPHYTFDVPSNKTTLVAKPEGSAWIYFADRFTPRVERLKEGQGGSPLALEKSATIDAATSFVWKYGTVSGGPYTEVLETTAVAGEFIPSFPASGVFYLACEVTTPEGTITSNELMYLVASDKLTPNFGDKQYIRGGKTGGEIVMAVEGTLESAEWKWSTTSGSGYQSFDPVRNGASIVPDFTTPGVYFLVLDAVIDGAAARSVEIEIEVTTWDSAELPLVWTGAVDEDFGNVFNWAPHAHPNRNNITVPVDAPVWPVFTSGTDTIYGGSLIDHRAAVMDGETVVEPEKKAQLIIRGGETDTLQWRNNTYGLRGILRIESGVFLKEKDLLRFEYDHSEIQLTGTGVAIFAPWNESNNTLCFGNSGTPSRGGHLYMSGQSKMYLSPAPIFRLTTNPDAAFAKIHITEEAEMVFDGDFVSGVATYNQNNRLVIAEEFELKNFYDVFSDKTIVGVRNLSAFAIANGASQYISIDQNIEALTLTNTAGLTDFTWKMAESALGPWSDFTTPVTGEQATVAFEAAGTYYIAAEAGDGTLTSNFVKVVVVDFEVGVSQVDGSYVLSVVLPDGATASGWMEMAPGSTEYAISEFGGSDLTYTLVGYLYADGEYLMTFEAILKDENDQDVFIMATPAVVTVAGGEITSVEAGVGTSVGDVKVLPVGAFPNPSKGSFTLNVDADQYVVEVIDFTGAVVDRMQLTGSSNTVTINDKGIYILRVISADGVGVERVVVK